MFLFETNCQFDLSIGRKVMRLTTKDATCEDLLFTVSIYQQQWHDLPETLKGFKIERIVGERDIQLRHDLPADAIGNDKFQTYVFHHQGMRHVVIATHIYVALDTVFHKSNTME